LHLGRLLGLCIFYTLSSCAPLPRQLDRSSTHAFQVSVSADGKTVGDFSERLVHHVGISETDLASFTRADERAPRLPIETTAEYDREGKCRGVRVRGLAAEGPALGLEVDDIITAVGVSHVLKPGDVGVIFEALQRNKRASLTLERAGRPHKIFYYLRGPGDLG
jgi:hypothetical protein